MVSSSSMASSSSSLGIASGSATLFGVGFGLGVKLWLSIRSRPKNFANSSSLSYSWCVSIGPGVDFAVPGVWAEFVLESRSTFSSFVTLCLLCIGPSQPLCEKLPRRISRGVGAFAKTSPVASHMPEGGLDSRNLREALRNRPVIPPDGLEAAPLFAVA